ncbi:unnamed protein product, partial [Ectocarpus sp. 8 AP-2014]
VRDRHPRELRVGLPEHRPLLRLLLRREEDFHRDGVRAEGRVIPHHEGAAGGAVHGVSVGAVHLPAGASAAIPARAERHPQGHQAGEPAAGQGW